MRRPRLRRPRLRDENGAATVEFIFIGVLILVPLFYIAIAIFDVQRNIFATSHAAREAGRAVATAPDLETGVYRAQYAVKLALEDQGASGSAVLSFVPSGDACGSGPAAPDPGAASIEAGAVYTVCVVSVIDIIGVPGFLEGESNTITFRYEVQVDKLRVKVE